MLFQENMLYYYFREVGQFRELPLLVFWFFATWDTNLLGKIWQTQVSNFQGLFLFKMDHF